MLRSVRDSFVDGAKWNAVGTFGHYLVSFFISIILSRLLSPAEFGSVAMLTIFIEVAKEFINSGFVVALVQKKECSEDDYSTVFIFNIVVGLFLYGVMFVSAPFISDFYDMPELTKLVRYQSLIIVVGSFGLVQTAIMLRDLNFKRKNAISLISVVVSAVFSIYGAFAGWGVYSLVAMNLSFEVTSNLLLWFLSKWRPSLVFSKDSFKSLFGFGSKLLAASLIRRIFIHIDSLLLGKCFSASVLGLYSKAKTTKELPITNTIGILSSAIFPIFSKIDDDERLSDVLLKMWKLIVYVIMPMMVGMIVVSDELIETLFSAKWLPSSPWMRILCVGGVASPLSLLLNQLISAKGRADVYLKVEIYKKVINLLLMIVGLLCGIEAFLWLSVVSSYIGLIVDLLYTSQILKINKIQYLSSVLSPLFLSLIMGGVVFCVGLLPLNNCAVRLVVMSIVGVVTYVSLSKMSNSYEYVYLKQVLREKFINKQ